MQEEKLVVETVAKVAAVSEEETTHNKTVSQEQQTQVVEVVLVDRILTQAVQVVPEW